MNEVRTYELAGMTERIIAFIIDSAILGAIGGFIGFGTHLFGGGLFSFLIGGAYQWYFLTHQNGQTIGKLIMGLQVVKEDGSPFTDGEAIMRYFGYILNSAIFMLGWVWAFVDDQNQGLHDKISHTFVVKADKVKNSAL
jgi:uncharacterized RDD family membrane protein YckC